MHDLIERQAAIDAIEEVDWFHQNRNKDMVSGANSSEHQAWYKADDIYKTLEALPPAQPEPHWIPVSERLPEYGKPVLWSNECGSVFTSAITYMNDHSWAIGKRHRLTKVTAWMPLPEPYAERRTE